jgi:hypothetical protein
LSVGEHQHVVGYHGTSREAAERILRSGFLISRNPYDWLGDGVYFFQDAPARAAAWAYDLYGPSRIVLQATIAIRDCLDLLDMRWTRTLTVAYDGFLAQLKRAGRPLPKQRKGSGAHRLDREVINYAVGVLSEQGVNIRVVRSAFIEGEPIFPDSALFDRSHVQLAVRDTSCIANVRIHNWREEP